VHLDQHLEYPAAMSDHTEPRLLILETSGRVGLVALAVGIHVAGIRQLPETRRHARDLAPAVAALLTEQSWQPRQVEAVVVSRGPGSYTGLRVGVMSAKAFAYAAGCAVLAIDTFAAVASQAPADVVRIDVLADAQQDKVYEQGFVRGPTGWQVHTPLAIRPFAEWLDQRDAAAWVTGPGLRKWEERLPAGILRVELGKREPQIESLLHLGLARWQAGERDDVWGLEPIYLRPSSAEEQWQARGR
jgi:tRNA threonylcarbamoyladenosine biosynthesis protein TsaB